MNLFDTFDTFFQIAEVENVELNIDLEKDIYMNLKCFYMPMREEYDEEKRSICDDILTDVFLAGVNLFNDWKYISEEDYTEVNMELDIAAYLISCSCSSKNTLSLFTDHVDDILAIPRATDICIKIAEEHGLKLNLGDDFTQFLQFFFLLGIHATRSTDFPLAEVVNEDTINESLNSTDEWLQFCFNLPEGFLAYERSNPYKYALEKYRTFLSIAQENERTQNTIHNLDISEICYLSNMILKYEDLYMDALEKFVDYRERYPKTKPTLIYRSIS